MVGDRGIDYVRASLLLFGSALVIALLVAGTTSGASFGTYNQGWDGTSSLQDLAEERDTDNEIVRNTTRYENAPPNGSIAVVLSPTADYDPESTARIEEFVRDGGTLLVASDFEENGNRLLSTLGANARVDGRLLRDERYYASGPVMPAARNVTSHQYTAGVDRLTLNYGSVVRADEGNVTTLVATSSYGYLDENRNGELDDNETLASYPVATVEPLGEGRVVTVSDPSLFINTMLAEPDNERFAVNLLGSHERILFDVSHSGGVPPLIGVVLLVRETALLQLLLGGASILVIAGWERLRDSFVWVRTRLRPTREHEATQREAIVEYLRDAHPDWDEERIDRVTKGIMAGESELPPND